MKIENLDLAGLPSASVVRMKLFTLDARLVIRKAGTLADGDRRAVVEALRRLLGSKWTPKSRQKSVEFKLYTSPHLQLGGAAPLLWYQSVARI
uniref:Uncharacterized protein n=1 Tax=Candidatus Kentrum sp. DK TaxID=2126562 RepID=A0A450SN19_9GAMM|nr:MAG: hypothetical protein BECKDK2373C_GA0170839_104637 [Candidatus Kentron sp. DK]